MTRRSTSRSRSRAGSVLVLNGGVPLKKAGIQPSFFWTTGLEISF